MRHATTFILMLLLATLLVSAQALWGGAVKGRHLLDGGLVSAALELLGNYRIWIGGVLYVGATALYFVLLSQYKFFFVQVTMTALVIIFSTVLAALIFHEQITAVNLIGVGFVITGLALVASS
jgi:drug/metabolite transporter (DMT)-like permease